VPVRLTLVGRAIEELPIVVVALRRTAERGLGVPLLPRPGHRRGRLSLLHVGTADRSHTLWEASSDRYSPPPATEPPSATDGRAKIRIELVTPLRMKHAGRLSSVLPPPLFLTALARRANALAILFGVGRPTVDEDEVEGLAEGVQVEGATLRLLHVRRYSARQARRMEWPGLVGELRWAGSVLPQLWPLLRFGELVQIGKGTALGFGRYRLVDAP
jgi:hypothetical protein